MTSLACAAGPDIEQAHTRRQWDVVGGQPSTEDQNSVVLVVRERFESWGTAVVVAPRLLMGSRHFLYEVEFGENSSILCPEEGRTTPVLHAWDPTTIQVFVGNARPLSPVVARGVNIYSGNQLDVCANDIALLEVDTDLPVDPLPMRLDQPPGVGEEGTLVGWGATRADLEMPSFQHLTEARQQRDVAVLAVGAGMYTLPEGGQLPVQASAFLGTEAGCTGDSGAPLLSKLTGAIIGVDSGEPNVDPTIGLDEDDARIQCVNAFTMFKRLDTQKDWLLSAFRAVGSAPWLEGYQRPAAFGGTCADERECLSGLCVTAGETAFCSQSCEREACPDGSDCVGSPGSRVCSIRNIAGASVDAGCDVTPATPGRRAPYLSIALCAAAMAWCRARGVGIRARRSSL